MGGLDLRGKRVAVGLSGGVDSVVLLDLLRAAAPRIGFRLAAVHVHHGLSPHADDWARFCRDLCRQWGVPLAVRRVKVEKRGRGIEA
ncbi:MAG: ATP-binding protein, partial [Burkholderiales bacterium]